MHPQGRLHLIRHSSRHSTTISLPSVLGPEDPLFPGPAVRCTPGQAQVPSKCWYERHGNPRGTVKTEQSNPAVP
ncbi:unnamed protein product [Gulo gulo]|uniref:Uncharacterized protein n=1 Tax=Gulo gulo TaxID=48420 RepID=A0A9X9QAF4_GULGU|nr:unnamed protein product [Gulo gulo]